MILPNPCSTCPYRKDVPAGVWHESEYAKLCLYDAETPEQPMATFRCHTHPEALCHGWAVCHMNRGHDRELLALRVFAPREVIPEPGVPLFGSGAEAAAHGLSGCKRPGKKAREAMAKLLRTRRRLQPNRRDK